MENESNINTPEMQNDNENEVAEKIEEKVTPKKSSFFIKNKKLLVILCFVLASIGVLVVFFLSSQAKKQKLNIARNSVYQAFKKGDYASAQKAAKEGLTIDSKDPYLLKNYIDAATSEGNQKGKETEALKTIEPYIKDLLKGNENDVEALLSAGYAYEAAGEYEKALTYYEKAISINPKSSEAYFHKGHVLAFLNKDSESQQAYDKAYELDPNNPKVLIIKARFLASEKDYENALTLLKRVGENPLLTSDIRAEAYTAEAQVEMERGNNLQAKEYAKKAVGTDKTYSVGRALYGFYLARDFKTYGEGIEHLTAAINLNPRISQNYLLLGVILRTNNYINQAINVQKGGLVTVFNDNTLVGQNSKDAMRGKMYYELAQTYSLANDVQNCIDNLKLATDINISYKTKLKEGVKFGYFAAIKNNPAFLNYLNSK